ncbi:MAG TPA: hypothetical protein VD886_09640 [Herpetosiphonaceae bacterium]|nr:hypothetical protein [Herpetosiphonaceae bacterium]
MPLTPFGHGGPGPQASIQIALGFGVIALIGGSAILALGSDPWGGLTIAGFGLLCLAMGGLMSDRVKGGLANGALLAAGVVGGLASLAAAIMLLRIEGVL